MDNDTVFTALATTIVAAMAAGVVFVIHELENALARLEKWLTVLESRSNGGRSQ